MRPDNNALAERGDLFDFVRSPGKAVAFGILAGAALVGAVMIYLNFDAVQAIGDDYRGRRGRVLAPYFAWLCLGLALVVALAALLAGLRAGAWQLKDGRALAKEEWPLDGDLVAAHERLATGDPRIYLPLPVSRRQNDARSRLRAYRADGDPVTFLTVSTGVRKHEKHLPLIVLEGESAAAFERSRKRLRKPFQG